MDATGYRTILSRVGVELTPGLEKALTSPAREKMGIGGWRGGKSVWTASELFIRTVLNFNESLSNPEQKALFWLIGPDYRQTREEYNFLMAWAAKTGLLTSASEAQEGGLTLQLRGGTTIETRSAQHYETIANVAPDAIAVCEAGQLSELARDQILGRSFQKNCPIFWSGTIEDDSDHPRWAWYEEQAIDWMDNPTPRHQVFVFPSWGNPIFQDCKADVEDDETLAIFCPDDNHGPAHFGELHPKIKMMKERWKDDPLTYARRIAAIPTGVPFQVYGQVTELESQILRPMTEAELAQPVLMAAGGLDYGGVHPTALVVGQLLPDPRDAQMDSRTKGILWVREVWFRGEGQNPGDTVALNQAKARLTKTWGAYRWNLDPNERYMARSFGGEATSYSTSARDARIELAKTRLGYGKLMFDLNGPGVIDLVNEMKKVHRRKRRDGMLELVRLNDDRTAALEDMIEAIDGTPAPARPVMAKRKYAPVKRTRQEFSRRF